jgi:hypothetical protein
MLVFFSSGFGFIGNGAVKFEGAHDGLGAV